MKGVSVLLAATALLAGTWADDACTQDELRPHEDCDKFYKCDRGELFPIQCQPGLMYDPVNEWCDWESSVDCDGRNVPDSGEAEPAPEEESREVEWLPNGCPNDNVTPWLIEHEECNKYYQCDNGVPVLKECPDGFLYDPVNWWCGWPWDVDCAGRIEGGSPAPASEETGPESTSEESNDGGAVAPPAVDAPAAPSTCPEDPTQHTLIAHESEPGLFYYCADGERTLRYCAPGLVFNPQLQVCDWP